MLAPSCISAIISALRNNDSHDDNNLSSLDSSVELTPGISSSSLVILPFENRTRLGLLSISACEIPEGRLLPCNRKKKGQKQKIPFFLVL